MSSNQLTVEERFSPLWKWGTTSLGLAAVILFIIFWNLEDVVWSGIIRLSSFICFSAAVIGALKLMEGKHTVSVRINEGHLKIDYLKKGKELHSDIFTVNEIKYVYPINLSKVNELNFTGDVLVPKICFKQSDRDLFMFFYGGRPLLLADGEYDKVIRFLKNNDITIQSSELTDNDHN